MHINIKKIVQSNTVMMLLSIIIPVVYASMLSTRTMPFAEGWYTYYASLINNGKVVYKDFLYLLPPLYIYLIAIITHIFGYKIIVLRIFGIILFGAISATLYQLLKQVFSNWISCVATVVSVLYMQSEIVQVFYDYVRLMDLFALLSMLFLIRYIKFIQRNHEPYNEKSLLLAGLFSALFVLIKQNSGLIFFFYEIVFILFSCMYWKIPGKQIIHHFILFFGGFIIPIFAFVVFLFCSGSFIAFFQSTGGNAIAAKGGMHSILFGWIINNLTVFEKQIKKTTIVFCIIAILYYVYVRKQDQNQNMTRETSDTTDMLLAVFYLVSVLIFLVAIAQKKSVHNFYTVNPYFIFLTATGTMIFLFFRIIIYKSEFRKVKDQQYTVFGLLTCYFAIAFGCGTSGGLSEGQSYLGLAMIISIALYLGDFRWSVFYKLCIMYVVLEISLSSIYLKMSKTYNWWGMDESNYWDSNIYDHSELPLLSGIGLSRDTKIVYDRITSIISKNTNSNDTMLCFPQIPIFYTICDREDPGIYSKVQWFDVTNDTSLQSDQQIIMHNQPKIILIYDTAESAYVAHEKLFRNGNISGTRKMREFLYNFTYENGYTYYGSFFANNNRLQLYIKENSNVKNASPFDGGNGTKEDPYLISSPAQLVALSKMVNEGRTFENQYISQTDDIDMKNITSFVPIGKYREDKDREYSCFKGNYNGNGYSVSNLIIDTKEGSSNNALFGYLSGTICNLSVINSKISGTNCASFASRTSETAIIANCYSNSTINGNRAGGIADWFSGTMINCVFSGSATGFYAGYTSDSQTGATYINGFDIGEYSSSFFVDINQISTVTSVIKRDQYTEDEIVRQLNEVVTENNLLIKKSLKLKKTNDNNEGPLIKIPLCKWNKICELDLSINPFMHS